MQRSMQNDYWSVEAFKSKMSQSETTGTFHFWRCMLRHAKRQFKNFKLSVCFKCLSPQWGDKRETKTKTKFNNIKTWDLPQRLITVEIFLLIPFEQSRLKSRVLKASIGKIDYGSLNKAKVSMVLHRCISKGSTSCRQRHISALKIEPFLSHSLRRSICGFLWVLRSRYHDAQNVISKQTHRFIQNGVAVFLLHRIHKKARQFFQSQIAVHTLKCMSERSKRNFILGNLK